MGTCSRSVDVILMSSRNEKRGDLALTWQRTWVDCVCVPVLCPSAVSEAEFRKDELRFLAGEIFFSKMLKEKIGPPNFL